MPDGQERVPSHHSGSGIAHDLLYFFAHGRRIAVYGALVANRFADAERTFRNTCFRIGEQLFAIGAQPSCRTVVSAAVNANHGTNSLYFAIHA